MRYLHVKTFVYSLVLLCIGLIFAGCSGTGGGSGGSGGGQGQVTGFIQDINGNSVRGATVSIGSNSTMSNTGGAYALTGVGTGDRLIKASITQNGVTYYGENVVQVFDNEQSRSTTVTVVPNSQRATVQGTVYDRNGFVVQGAKVFAASTELTSTFDITDSNGQFRITTLYGGKTYAIVASAQGYNSDTDTITVAAGNSLTQDYTLANVTDPSMAAIDDLSATAWTTPGVGFLRGGHTVDYDALKNMIKPSRKSMKMTAQARPPITSGGNLVEIDLFWTPTVPTTNLLGYGIYRGQGDTTNFTDSDFWRDPLAVAYADLDLNFAENQTWSYVVTSLNTSFGIGSGGESADSNRVVAHTLGDLDLNSPLFGPLTFRWFLVTSADSYKVYLYDVFPGIGTNGNPISPVWTSPAVFSNAKVYDGPALQPGHTYYYFVEADGFSGNSVSLSVIDSFVAP